MDFGTERSVITTFRNSEIVRTMKQFKIRVRVRNAEEEMAEYIRFTAELAKARQEGTLTYNREDPATLPAFTIEYTHGKEEPYFIVKNYCIVV